MLLPLLLQGFRDVSEIQETQEWRVVVMMEVQVKIKHQLLTEPGSSFTVSGIKQEHASPKVTPHHHLSSFGRINLSDNSSRTCQNI